MDPLAKGPLQPRVLIQALDLPGLGHGQETLPEAFDEGFDLGRRHRPVRIHTAEKPGLFDTGIELAIEFGDELGVRPGQIGFLRLTGRQQGIGDGLGLEFLGQGPLLQFLILGQHLMQGGVVLPDDDHQDRPDQTETQTDLLADTQSTEQKLHLCLLSPTRHKRFWIHCRPSIGWAEAEAGPESAVESLPRQECRSARNRSGPGLKMAGFCSLFNNNSSLLRCIVLQNRT